MRPRPGTLTGLLAAIGLTLLLVACEGAETPELPPTAGRRADIPANSNTGSVFGEGGLSLFGGGNENQPDGGGSGIGVNSFLWRASLDTISFMPVNSADPFGGVIITDWHAPAQTQAERFKLNIYILGRALRADGVRVATFRQVRNNAGLWVDAPVPPQTNTSIEDAILTRARQLRSETINQ